MPEFLSGEAGHSSPTPLLGFGLPPLGYAENSILHINYKGFIDRIHGKLDEFRCYEAKIKESEKGRQPPRVEPAAGLFHFALFSPHNI